MASPIAWGVAAWLCVAPAPDEVRAEAERLWQAGDDAGVATLFSRAYAEDPRPEYLFGQARAEAARGRCEVAIELWVRFVATDPPRQQALAAHEQIRACGGDPDQAVAELETSRAGELRPQVPLRETTEVAEDETTVPPSVVVPTPRELRPPPRASVAGRRLEPATVGLLVSGGVLAAAGAVALGLGLDRVRRPGPSRSDDDYAARIRQGRAAATAGAVALSIGGTLLVTGIVHHVVRRHRTRTLARR
jgi:hypothetical protein